MINLRKLLEMDSQFTERFTDEQIHDVFYNVMLSNIFNLQEKTGKMYIFDTNDIMLIIQTLIYESEGDFCIGGIPLNETNSPPTLIKFIERVRLIKNTHIQTENNYLTIAFTDCVCESDFVKDLVIKMHTRLQEFYEANNAY